MKTLLRAAVALAFAATVLHITRTDSYGRMQKRWLFVWRDMSDPKEVERVIARLPAAHQAGYNGLALSYHVVESRAGGLRQAAKANGMDIVAIVMGGGHDRNYVEGPLVENALFV